MSNTLQTILTRRAIRSYKPDPVAKEDLEKIVLAGAYSATGRGLQSPIILAITNKEVRDELMHMNQKVMGENFTADPFYGAPVILVVLAKKEVATHVYDGSLVLGNMMLEAHELGLGSCWIHRAKEEFETEEGKALLQRYGINGEYEGIGHLALGHIAGEAPEPKERKADWVTFIE